MISTMEELDEKLCEVKAAGAVSDDKMREVFQSFKMKYPTDLPPDPYSAAYSDRQFEIYRAISGRDSYEVVNEESNFPVDPNRPFPFYTESPETVGHQLMGVGFIIRTMQLPSGSSILELGAGWGNTTVALARMGYQMTAIDIDPTFTALIKERGDRLSLSIEAINGGFLDVDKLDRTFDAVLFYEAFHHCSDHRTMVDKLAKVLSPGGKLFFAAEPIDDSFPAPWGLRMDGESLWAIRDNGWLELGYQESYFVRMLQHHGWVARKHVSPATHLAVIFEARRANDTYIMSTFDLPPDEDATWAIRDQPGVEVRFTGRRSKISLERGLDRDFVVVDATNNSPGQLPYAAIHGAHRVAGVADPHSEVTIRLPYDPAAAQLVIEADTWRPSDLLGSADVRELGLMVRTINLVNEP
jgi:2-polyprenyl-3-methyl-5-hydroxy-6-metoxy-1,4-benzoquinol methylase